MKRKDFLKSLAALPFVAKAIADPLTAEELAAKEAADKAKAGIRAGNKFEEDFSQTIRSSNRKGRGDFKMFNEDPKYISCSTAEGFYDYDNEFFATTSLILKAPNKHGRIY